MESSLWKSWYTLVFAPLQEDLTSNILTLTVECIWWTSQIKTHLLRGTIYSIGNGKILSNSNHVCIFDIFFLMCMSVDVLVCILHMRFGRICTKKKTDLSSWRTLWTVCPLMMNTSVISSVNILHEYPMLTAVSVRGEKRRKERNIYLYLLFKVV